MAAKNKYSLFGHPKSSVISAIILCIILINASHVSAKQKNDRILALPKIDMIIVNKKNRLMALYKNYILIKQYKIALGSSPIGHKLKEGDGKTPEGRYTIVSKNAKSAYHLSLKISYPSKNDVANARKNGNNPGGDIMIHGLKKEFSWLGKFHRFIDWTRGCIAVSNEEIEEIYDAVTIGVPVEIKP
jgi:murein L,D-transpeptidase YafK